MALLETTTHSFVVKVWLEEPITSFKDGRWRGHITHVPSNHRRYFDDLEVMKQFVRFYLESMISDSQNSDK